MADLNRRTLLASAASLAISGGVLSLTAGCATSGPFLSPTASPAPSVSTKVAVYGGTPSGISAAVAAARSGVDVELILGESPLGGMMSNGLGRSDVLKPALVGGLADAFFRKVGALYDQSQPVYNFEPHTAEQAFQSMLNQYSIMPRQGILTQIAKSGTVLESIQLDDGTTIKADIFIDASYEGLLLQMAAVTTTYGRESSNTYGEKRGGYGYHLVHTPVDGAAGSTGLSGVQSRPAIAVGQADSKIMAFNFRLCLSDDPKLLVPFARTTDYNPDQFELLARAFKASVPLNFSPKAVAAHKYDLNGGGFFDTDLVGGSWDYPKANLGTRRAISSNHKNYMKDLLYYLGNEPTVPDEIRKQVNTFGLASDEFTTTDNWPAQLYVRENVRMVGKSVLAESDLLARTTKVDTIAVAGYPMDCHYVQRFLDQSGNVVVEGTLPPKDDVDSYEIPFSSLLPRPSEATNLVASVCVSVSHVAWASIRVEPTFMALGEAAGTAAALAVLSSVEMNELDVSSLQSTLRKNGALISSP